MIYRIYCVRHFQESHVHWVWDKSILKPMLVYSGWNLYGALCLTTRQQGTNFLINIFFGVVFNAASSVATTIQGVVKGFTYSSTMAFRPQIVKHYAQKNFAEMLRLMKSAMSLCIFLSLLVSIPLFVEIHYVMDLWLVNPPVMAVEFVRLLIVSAFFALITLIFTIGIEATGYNRQMNIYTGSVFLLTIPVMYVCFKLGCGVLYSYYCILGANILIFLSNMIICKRLVPELRLMEYVWMLFKTAIVVAVSLLPVLYVNHVLEESFLRLVINVTVLLVVLSVLSYWLILDDSSRLYIRTKVLAVVNKFGMHSH